MKNETSHIIVYISQIANKTVDTQCFFTDHLNYKTVNKKTCRTPSANPHPVVNTTYQRSQLKIWKNLSLKSKSIEEQMVWISIVFTFYLLES